MPITAAVIMSVFMVFSLEADRLLFNLDVRRLMPRSQEVSCTSDKSSAERAAAMHRRVAYCCGTTLSMFDIYLTRWKMLPDGSPIFTRSAGAAARASSGRAGDAELATEEEERFGGLLIGMVNGDGAARVLARDDNALLAGTR